MHTTRACRRLFHMHAKLCCYAKQPLPVLQVSLLPFVLRLLLLPCSSYFAMHTLVFVHSHQILMKSPLQLRWWCCSSVVYICCMYACCECKIVGVCVSHQFLVSNRVHTFGVSMLCTPNCNAFCHTPDSTSTVLDIDKTRLSNQQQCTVSQSGLPVFSVRSAVDC